MRVTRVRLHEGYIACQRDCGSQAVPSLSCLHGLLVELARELRDEFGFSLLLGFDGCMRRQDPHI